MYIFVSKVTKLASILHRSIFPKAFLSIHQIVKRLNATEVERFPGWLLSPKVHFLDLSLVSECNCHDYESYASCFGKDVTNFGF